MSKFKDQLKKYLSQVEIKGPRVLSIGGQEDDKRYFGKISAEEWLTLDSDSQYRPTITFDMNRSMQSEGGFDVPDRYLGYFDVVLALNLWEYIFDPLTAHQNIVDFLKPGGLLMTNYPFVYPVHNPSGIDYLRYTPEGVEKLIKSVGLTIVKHDFIYGSDLLEDFYADEGMKARSGFDHKIVGSIITARKG